MREELRSRFKDAPWFPKTGSGITCIIGGAGGIGSWLTFLLARIGYDIIVFDYDRVEQHNIGGQLYSVDQINLPKVEALRDVVDKFSKVGLNIYNERYTKDSIASKFMFSAFDNMKARRDMFENWYETNKDNKDALFIDGRLLLEQMQIFCVTLNRADDYRKRLFDDEEIQEADCTLKQTSHSAAMIASKMVAFFTNHITNMVTGNKVRELPFYEEYFIPLNMIETEL